MIRKQIIAVVIICLSLICSAAIAQDSEGFGPTSGTCGSNLTWMLNDAGVLTISGSGAMSNYTGSAGSPWTVRKDSITSVVVDNGVTSIGNYAFSGCYSLSSASLPASLETIGNNAFMACSNLASITVPSGVTAIGANAFASCSKLKNVSLPSTLTSIGDYSFYNCTALTEIPLPNGLTSIGEFALSWSGLRSITLPDSLTQMGRFALSHNRNLSSVTWTGSMKTVPYATFSCMDADDFSSPLTEITLPEGVTTIGPYAFQDCSLLSSITLPVSIETINESAFCDSANLSDVYYAGTKAQAAAIQFGTGNSYLTSTTWHCSDVETIGIGATSGTCGSNLTWTLNDAGVLTISGTGAMSNYTGSAGSPWTVRKDSITSVVVDNGVTSIGNYAFSGCYSLSSASLPASLETIGNNAFMACSNLASITVPFGVTAIGDYAFAGGSALENVSLPSTLTSIGDYAFIGLAMTEITLPNGLTSIGEFAFSWSSLHSITLPDSLTQMGRFALSHNRNLSSVTWTGSMKTVPYATFSCMDADDFSSPLTEITLPEGVTTIGSYAFQDCSLLSSITLPVSIEAINENAFIDSAILSDVYYAGTKAQAEAIQIGPGNNYLTSATWHFIGTPQPVTSTFTLPSGLETIEVEAFSGINATTIIIPAAVDEIKSKAFANCNHLEMLYFEGSPYSIATDILSGCGTVTISVVEGSSAEKWAKKMGYAIIYH